MPLIALLRAPEQAAQYSADEWAAVLETGQRHQLLGQLGARLTCVGQIAQLPTAVQRHLALAMLTSQRRTEAAVWEINAIRHWLPDALPITLLKGAAYALHKDANAAGRVFSDLDILVPRIHLDEAEASLFAQGWRPGEVDAYDRKYYRQWMHEIPPMTHVRRQTVLDLHHGIVPVVSRYSFPQELLFRQQTEISPGLFVLSPIDRVIHCAVHAVMAGDAGKLLKDLYDLYLLQKQHAALKSERSLLFSRAAELGLESLVSPAIEAAIAVFGKIDPPKTKRQLARLLVDAALDPGGGSSLRGRFATTALLGFSHWIKMPARMLVPHLIRKTLMEYLLKGGHKVG